MTPPAAGQATPDEGPSPVWIVAGGALAVYTLAGSRNPYALLGGAWVGGVVPLAYAAWKTDPTHTLTVRTT